MSILKIIKDSKSPRSRNQISVSTVFFTITYYASIMLNAFAYQLLYQHNVQPSIYSIVLYFEELNFHE